MTVLVYVIVMQVIKGWDAGILGGDGIPAMLPGIPLSYLKMLKFYI